MAGGWKPSDIEHMALRDWLDVGERMLTKPITDPLTRDIFGRLFEADTEAEMEAVFAELGELGQSLSAEAKVIEAKEREKRKVHRRVSPDAMADAAAEWGMELPEGWGSQK